MAERPAWLARAMDPDEEIHPTEGAIHTVHYTYEGNVWVAPTVRKGKDGLYVLSADEAMDEGISRGDHIKVPEGMTGTEFSIELSKIVGRARKNRGRPAGKSAEKGN